MDAIYVDAIKSFAVTVWTFHYNSIESSDCTFSSIDIVARHLVYECGGPDEEKFILLSLRVCADGQLSLGVRHHLALLRHLLADEDGADVGLHQGGVAHVAHTE